MVRMWGRFGSGSLVGRVPRMLNHISRPSAIRHLLTTARGAPWRGRRYSLRSWAARSHPLPRLRWIEAFFGLAGEVLVHGRHGAPLRVREGKLYPDPGP